MLTSPSELAAFLEKLGIRPKKGLSQNFLIDGNIARKIVAAADIQPGDLVLEIGPGPGALTELLVEAGAEVVAVEKDTILGEALKRLPVTVHVDDVMKVDLGAILPRKAKVVANLPYQITTPVITKLLERHDLFTHVVVMVQDEVARRFTAKPGCKEYGSITVFLNFHSDPTYAFKVKQTCFHPAPKVDSAVVSFTLKTPPDIDEEAFFTLTRTAFNQRRKMLRRSLRDLYPPEKIEEALCQLGLSPQARPEELSVEQFVRFLRVNQTFET